VKKSKKLLQKINKLSMTKLEKLREINATLNDILIKKETYIFVENIDTDDKKKIKEPQPKVVVEIKQ
jgi:hypothetical protein